MLLDVGALLLGGLLLYLGAEWLVKGAAGLARAFGIRPLVIGLTIVAYGTSAPELVVSAVAAVQGRGAIAVGNVIGSNIANIGLILGVTALIAPPAVDGALARRELPVLAATTLLIPVLLWNGVISRLESGLLVLGALAFTAWILRAPPRGASEPAEIAEREAEAGGAPSGEGRIRLAAIAAVGLGLLVGGGKLFVEGATGLALALGVSERIVGLTIVAIGTSLPELAASVIAAMRKHSEMAVGNVIGSNIFNVLLIFGGAGLIAPIESRLSASAFDLAALGVAVVLALVLLRGERVVSRLEGGLLVATYAGFLIVLALL
jgi:cation:H+ antiporter